MTSATVITFAVILLTHKHTDKHDIT